MPASGAMPVVPFISTCQMREVDRAMVEDYGILLVQMMENAGRALAHLARRRFLGGDPLLYSVLYMLLIAMYVQGIFNQVVYWPTYTWSFLHVVLASMFICIAREIRDGNAQGALPSMWDEFDEDDEEAESFEDFGDSVGQPAS